MPLLTRIFCFLLMALPCVSLALNALSLVRFGIDVPFWDDWRQYHSNRLGDISLAYLFTPVNDTLFPVGKFLDAMAIRWLDGHSVAYQLTSLLGVLGALLALQWRLLSLCVASPPARAVAFFFTLPMLQSGSYWGLQNLAFHQALPLVCLLFILWLTLDEKLNRRWLVPGCVVLGLISGLSYTSGAVAVLGLSLVLIAAGRFITAPSRQLAVKGVSQAVTSLGLRIKSAGQACLLPGLICTTAQFWVIVVVQKGLHVADFAMAYPWEGDFWWYSLGKVGRALMLDRQQPLLSLTIALLVVALVVIVFIQSVRALLACRSSALQVTPADSSGTVACHIEPDSQIVAGLRRAVVFSALVVVIGLYLGLVAAGRANFRPDFISSPLQIFSFGFERFHFFWVTLIWPWVIVVLISTRPFGKPISTRRVRGRRIVLVALMLVVVEGIGNAFNHAFAYKDSMSLRSQGMMCLNQKLGDGVRPLACPTLHIVDSPELLPDDLTNSIKHALAHDVSFVQNLDFSFLALGTQQPPPTFSLLDAPKRATYENLDWMQVKEVEPDRYLKLQSSNNDPSITFSTEQVETMRGCSILDVSARLALPSLDIVQFFFVPGGSNRFTEESSRLIRTDRVGEQTVSARIISSTGFSDHFRFDPGTQPGSITIYDLELRCRF